MEPMRAKYVAVDTGRVLGECSNLAAVTWGQGAAIGGHPYRSAPQHHVVGSLLSCCTHWHGLYVCLVTSALSPMADWLLEAFAPGMDADLARVEFIQCRNNTKSLHGWQSDLFNAQVSCMDQMPPVHHFCLLNLGRTNSLLLLL